MVDELFTNFTRKLIIAFALLAALLCSISAHAQNAGVVGIYTQEIQVFNGQTATGSSGGTWQCNGSPTPIACPVLPDHGAAANILTFCNTSFIGSIDLEWEPVGTSTYLPLQTAVYTSADSNCHRLQVGGYYPNLRSRIVSYTSGIINAWYTASAAPIPYFGAAIGSNGPTSQIVCDQPATVLVSSGATGALIPTTPASGLITVLCELSMGFAAVPTAGSVSIGWGTDTTCTTPSVNWSLPTTATGIPPILNFPDINLRSAGPSGFRLNQVPCLVNSSGQNVTVNLTFATVLVSSL